ncbi:MAG: 3-deoxy-manno-octulosonate cytidylyltransferase [Lachnospiraceae bacterium]|nr:3-deoxy-manno-octulosonate cytidylyltransferase [Lachnospiraceae bacterium]
MRNIVAVLPARYQSSRFPGKPLAMIAGKRMIQRVYEQVKQVSGISRVVVATDDERIYSAVRQFQGEVIMTGNCSCGTERVYEAIKGDPCDIVINVQGDEPLIKPEMINELIAVFEDDKVVMATLCKEITEMNDINSLNIVKVVRDRNDNALYFSRYPVPFNRDERSDVKYFKHIGIYGYKKEFLEEYVQLEKTPLEIAENLEQLRVLENGYKIKVKETIYDSMGVDTPEDVLRVEKCCLKTDKGSDKVI